MKKLQIYRALVQLLLLLLIIFGLAEAVDLAKYLGIPTVILGVFFADGAARLECGRTGWVKSATAWKGEQPLSCRFRKTVLFRGTNLNYYNQSLGDSA